MASFISPQEEVVNNALLLDYILKTLSLKHLIRASAVCKQWHQMAMKEIRRRNGIETLFYSYIPNAPRARHPKSRGKDPEPGQGYIAENVDGLKKYIESSLTSVRALPKFAILFHGGFCPRSRSISTFFNDDVLFQHIPKDCEIVTADSTAGVIGISAGPPQRPIEIQTPSHNLAGISYVFLPNINDEDCFIVVRSAEALKDFVPKKNGEHKKLKAIAFFAGCPQVKEVSKVVDLMKKYDHAVAFGGLVVDRVGFRQTARQDQSRFSHQEFLAIAFFGDYIKAASIVLMSQTEKETEKELIAFKNALDFDPSDTRSGETLGILFICTGRGLAIYNKHDVEATLVKQIFPNIKLTGLFGYGEFGANYWPKSEPQPPVGYQHSYTTIFLLLKFLKKPL